ncbi:helix-turn-helix transcriptional regulator [uncultured Ruminococcus sp.]|uniref:helix-turn-helix domain-containing protein n=1 Tax=uncultured Ruminococcus sp. TaxID=165186 RepID=UPI0025F3BF1E|nr:helix-turn-helix transcriptional regulator [uncultured Ruminococcus sp.]
MAKELLMLADRIKHLRESSSLTQAELARKLSLSRSAINAWEMGLSVPTSQYVVELAKVFSVSTDYILGINETAVIPVTGLTDEQIDAVLNIINCFRNANNK